KPVRGAIAAGEAGTARDAGEAGPAPRPPIAEDRHLRRDVRLHETNARAASREERPRLLATGAARREEDARELRLVAEAVELAGDVVRRGLECTHVRERRRDRDERRDRDQQRSHRLPRSACSRSIDSKSALKLPSPKVV